MTAERLISAMVLHVNKDMSDFSMKEAIDDFVSRNDIWKDTFGV